MEDRVKRCLFVRHSSISVWQPLSVLNYTERQRIVAGPRPYRESRRSLSKDGRRGKDALGGAVEGFLARIVVAASILLGMVRASEWRNGTRERFGAKKCVTELPCL